MKKIILISLIIIGCSKQKLITPVNNVVTTQPNTPTQPTQLRDTNLYGEWVQDSSANIGGKVSKSSKTSVLTKIFTSDSVNTFYFSNGKRYSETINKYNIPVKDSINEYFKSKSINRYSYSINNNVLLLRLNNTFDYWYSRK